MLYNQKVKIEVVIENSETEDTCRLYYLPLQTDLVNRWINLINISNEKNLELESNYQRILSEDGLKKKLEEFKENISEINKSYDRSLPIINTIEDLVGHRSVLNDLHEEYEIYGNRLEDLLRIDYFSDPNKFSHKNKWPGKEHDYVLHDRMLKLNNQIHNFENISKYWEDRNLVHCYCLADFIPAGLHEDLKPEDYLLFTPSMHWGWMYLGYNTLGKPWYCIVEDDDVDVVKRHEVRPQKRFAAEFFLEFNRESPVGFTHQVLLYQWFMKNNFNEMYKEPLRLDELALGYIPLAKLLYWITSDSNETMLAKNINTQEEKMLWNKQVWSKYDKIQRITVISRSV